MMLKYFFCLLAFSICAIFPQAHAQKKGQTIRGVIKDKASNAPIPNASIEILNYSPRISTNSQKDGSFSLKNVPLGRHRLLIQAQGYEHQLLSNLTINSAKELIIDINLDEHIEKKVFLPKHRVIKKDVRRFRNEKMEVSNQMAIVDIKGVEAADINRYSGSLNDPARLITNFPGMYNTDDTQNYIISRGNSPLGIRWIVEDVPINNPSHFATLGNTGGPLQIINPNSLARSDFYSGAYPSEYNNAFSSVFDIKLKKGNNQNFEFTGQFSLLGLEASAEGPLNKKGNASFQLSYRYGLFQLIKALGISFGSNSTPEYHDLNFRVDIQNDKVGNFTLFGLGGFSKVDLLNKDIDPNDPFAERGINLNIQARTGLLGLKHQKFLNKKTYLKTTLSFLHENYNSHRDRIDSTVNQQEYLSPYFAVINLRNRPGVQTIINSKLNRQTILRSGIYGYYYFFDIDDYYLESNKRVYFAKQANLHIGGFTQVKYRISPKFAFSAGLHGHHFTMSKRAWSVEPRLGFNWQAGKRTTLSIGYGLNSKMQPAVMSFIVLEDSLGNYDRSNQDLGFTKSHHFSLSYSITLAKDWGIKITAYTQRLFDIPITDTSSSYSLINYGAFPIFPLKTQLVNEGKARNYGVEFSVEKFFSNNYYGLISASYSRSKYLASDKRWRNTSFDVQYILQFLAGKEFLFGKSKQNALTLDLRFTHRGGRPYTPIDLHASKLAGEEVLDYDRSYQERLKAYTRLDLKIGARFNNIKKGISHQIFLDLINPAFFKNELEKKYNPLTEEIITAYQFGLLPNLMYRIQF